MKTLFSLLSAFAMLTTLAFSSSLAASYNDNSDYAVCHEPGAPGWCDYTCGIPSTRFCEFTGWMCTWDNEYFLRHPDVKGDLPLAKLGGDWAENTPEHEDDAEVVAITLCFNQCMNEGGNPAFCGGKCADTSMLICEWQDWHCAVPQSPTQCLVRGF